MKKILVFLLSVVVIVTAISCSRQIPADTLINETQQIWDNSEQNSSTMQLGFKDLNIGGVININNLVFDIEKKIINDKILLNVETRKNMSVKINDNVKGVIDKVLDYKKLEGNLKVKHLEQAWSKIGLKMNFEMDSDNVTGKIELLNAKDMFKGNLSKSIVKDCNLSNLSQNEQYKGIYSYLKAHPIGTLMPKQDGNVSTAKSIPMQFNSKEICGCLECFLQNNCDKRINNSEMTLKHILFDVFGETTAQEIEKNTVILQNPTGKITTIKKNGKNFVDNMKMQAKFSINVSKNQLLVAAKDLTDAYQNEKLYNLLKSMIDVLNYDKALVQGDIDVMINNNILK